MDELHRQPTTTEPTKVNSFRNDAGRKVKIPHRPLNIRRVDFIGARENVKSSERKEKGNEKGQAEGQAEKEVAAGRKRRREMFPLLPDSSIKHRHVRLFIHVVAH